MKLHKRLLLERLHGQSISDFMKARGWIRDIHNNTFHKKDKTLFYYYPYLVINWDIRTGLTQYHRIKIG